MTVVERAVAQLLEARRTNTQQAAPTLPDAAAAYAVQAGVAVALGWFRDAAPRHWKSGGPSREAMLTHAPLPPALVRDSPADLGDQPFHVRGIEAEIALRLGESVDAARAATLDLDSARQLVDAMCVSIEVVDTRWREGLDAPPLAKLADLQAHGALVLGVWQPFVARDWAVQKLRVRIGTQLPRDFRGSHSMADPAFVLPAWLRHATQGGAVLGAGTIVTTGTWCGLLHAHVGDDVEVQFDGIGVAGLRC